MTKFPASEDFYKGELDELYKILNDIDRKMEDMPSAFISAYNNTRSICLYRIRLVEGWLSEISTLKSIN
jgi:hypothetical protein